MQTTHKVVRIDENRNRLCMTSDVTVVGLNVILKVSLLTVDDLHCQVPPLEKDLYYDEPPPDYLPYTKSSAKSISQPHMGSTADIQ